MTIQRILDDDVGSPEHRDHSILLQYLLNANMGLLEFMIISCLKQMEVNTYQIKEFSELEMSPNLQTSLQNCSRLLDFASIYRRNMEVLDHLPTQCFPIFADAFARLIYKSMLNGTLTWNSVQAIAVFDQDRPSNYETPTLFELMMRKMMEIASDNLHLVRSKSATEARTYYQWIVFVIRLGTSATNSRPSPNFGTTLRIHQKAIVSSILQNLKWIPHQTFALGIVKHFLVAVNEHYTIHEESPSLPKPQRAKAPFLEDIEEFARLDKLCSVLSSLLPECETIPIQILAPLLEAGFKAKDRATKEIACHICLKLFTPESALKWTAAITDSFRRLLKAFFDSVDWVSDELAVTITSLMPLYASAYMTRPHLKQAHFGPFCIEGLDVDMCQLLTMIGERLTDSNDEVSQLLSLCSCCFGVILDRAQHVGHQIDPSLRRLTSIFCHCGSFDHVTGTFASVSALITQSFGDLFVRGVSNSYLFALLDVIGKNRWKPSNPAMDLCRSFFYYCRDKGRDEHFIELTYDQIFTVFAQSSRLFSILTGFSFFVKYCGHLVRLDHVRTILIQTTECLSPDETFARVLNRFLIDFVKIQSPACLHAFVLMVE
jgi:hypothetical protein